MNALQGVIACLEKGTGAVELDEPVRARAQGCIQRMLDFVAAHPAAVRQPALVPHIGAA